MEEKSYKSHRNFINKSAAAATAMAILCFIPDHNLEGSNKISVTDFRIITCCKAAINELNIIKGPYLQWPTQKSMTIMWETHVDASSIVVFWETEKVHSSLEGRFKSLPLTEREVTVQGKQTIHCVTLTGLQPETTYNYIVKSEDESGRKVSSEEFVFKTAVNPETPFRFIVTSETGGFGDTTINLHIFDQIYRYRPDFLLFPGDMVQNGVFYDEWNKFLFGPGKNVLTTVPFYLTMGNHEINGYTNGDGRRKTMFYSFVSYPEPENYYSFQYGNGQFIGLDCTMNIDYNKEGMPVLINENEPSIGKKQYDFLVKCLSESNALWKIVFFHYPPYVSGNYQVEFMRDLCPLFEKAGVDIVFNSHTIVYERSFPLKANMIDHEKGVIYIVAGGAGAIPSWFHPHRSFHTAEAVAVPHFVQVSVAGPYLELKAIDDAGNVFDFLILEKSRIL